MQYWQHSYCVLRSTIKLHWNANVNISNDAAVGWKLRPPFPQEHQMTERQICIFIFVICTEMKPCGVVGNNSVLADPQVVHRWNLWAEMLLSRSASAKPAYRASQNEKKCHSINTEGINSDEGTSQDCSVYDCDILIKAGSRNVFFKDAF